MATSSITANFEIKDAKIARAFVDALLSGRPNRKIPRPNPTWETVSGTDGVKAFFGESLRV